MSTEELIAEINPVIRGWGQYYHKAHVRKLFARLYDEMGLVRLVFLIPSIKPRYSCAFVKAVCGKSARTV